MIKDIFSFCIKCMYNTNCSSSIENVRLCLRCARQTIQYQSDFPIEFKENLEKIGTVKYIMESRSIIADE